MIRLLEDDGSEDIKLYGTVNYAGYDWYVIGLKGNEVTLLAKSRDFGKRRFDKDSADYETSEIRQYLLADALQEIIGNGADPLPTDLPDVGVTGDRLWLLSADEAKELPKDIRKCAGGDWWWLRNRDANPLGSDDCAAYVVQEVYTDDMEGMVDINDIVVRPAMRVKLKDLQNNSL